MPDIQVFGLDNDPATRAAQRFFRERRVVVSFVDLRKRRIAPAELRRFVERLGARALLDETSRAYRDGGLAYLSMDDAGIVERLLADASLLRLPLVRHGNEVTAGRAEATWTSWLKAAAAS
jgi:arsenate reductase-like glutaredoxin family protein